jgi:N-acetylmuramoyl-L-alanine amidase
MRNVTGELSPELVDAVFVLAQTIYGEARNQRYGTKLGVGWTVKNRVALGTWYGTSVREVCLKRWQYSCWNEGDPNREKLLVPRERQAWLACVEAAWAVLLGEAPDPTGGATHYYDQSLDDNPPRWARRATRV